MSLLKYLRAVISETPGQDFVVWLLQTLDEIVLLGFLQFIAQVTEFKVGFIVRFVGKLYLWVIEKKVDVKVV